MVAARPQSTAAAPLRHAVAAYIAALRRTRRWHRVRRDRALLATLSDEQLADIGISHGGIDRVVRYGREAMQSQPALPRRHPRT